MLMAYVKAFCVGGFLCMVGQWLMMKTNWTPARILVGYVTLGVVLSALGLYGRLIAFAGAGATVPLTGFGHALCQGVIHAVQEQGVLGIFTGGLGATAGGITAAVIFATLMAVCFKPRAKT